MSPVEAILAVRDKVLAETDRALAELVIQPAEHGPRDLRATRLVLVDLHDLFNKRGEKDKAAVCLQCAQFITAELR